MLCIEIDLRLGSLWKEHTP